MALTITSANSSYILSIAGLYPTGQKLQGYMADAAFASEAVETAETVLGVDGYLSGGWLPTAIKQTISLMPDSPSYAIFENWTNAQNAQREVMTASATIVIASLGKTYTCTKGFLTRSKMMPDAKKVMQGSEFEITWNTITPSNL
ncbi:MAG: hypothetical protein LBH31_09450 [Burkholderiaceae bacterium]|jgi:hypothetical protein|nr:hypothetical protein [Burkholderiaceae bacterium]